MEGNIFRKVKDTGPGYRFGGNEKIVALVGNTGVGKTALFQHLAAGAGSARKIVGCDDKLIEARMSFGRTDAPSPSLSNDSALSTPAAAVLVDTPGTALFFSQNGIDQATRRFLFSGAPDCLLFVADAKNLRRSLILFFQVAELQLPTTLILNMIDEAEKLGFTIDLQRLARFLTVDLCSTVAVGNGCGKKIRALLGQAQAPAIRIKYPQPIEKAVIQLANLFHDLPIAPRALALMLLSGNALAQNMVNEKLAPQTAAKAHAIVVKTRQAYHVPLDVVIAETVAAKAEDVVRHTSRASTPHAGRLSKLNQYVSNPSLGLPIALLILICGYLWIGLLGADIAVDLIDKHLLRGILLPLCERALSGVHSEIVQKAIFDPGYGLLPSAVFLAVGVAFPVLLLFYFFVGILEDSGYLPRLAMLLDRPLRVLGLTGKGMLPMALGLSCVTVAVMGTRVLESKKERLIATFLLLLSFPCAEFLAVVLVVLATLPRTATAFLLISLVVQTVAAGILANRIIPGRTSDFILEISPLRLPHVRIIWARAFRNSMNFIKEALPIFIGVSLALFALDRLGVLGVLEKLSAPVIQGALGLPEQAVQVFVQAIVRRVNGAAQLAAVYGDFSPLQIVITLFVMTTLAPCVNTTLMIFKQQGIRVGLLLTMIVFGYAILAGVGLNLVCRLLHITFT